MTEENLFWVERYRPRKVEDCILPAQMLATFSEFVNTGSVPNLLLSGTQGTGKTTVARALCEQLGYDYILINGSNEGRLLDTLRSKITAFASSVSMFADRKCVIVDECDFLPLDTVQPAMRSFIEQFANNCSFILTCNYKNRLMPALHSRFTNIEFKVPHDEQSHVQLLFFKRICFILDKENVKYDKQTIAALIKKFFPDWRRVINELQRYSVTGSIDANILTTLEGADVEKVVQMMIKKDFRGIHDWVFSSPSIDMAQMCRELINELRKYAKPEYMPSTYILIADYQHKSLTAIDPQINMVAMFAALLMEIVFK